MLLWMKSFLIINVFISNLVPRVHMSFGQCQNMELWNNQFPESKILGVPVSWRLCALVYMASRGLSWCGRVPKRHSIHTRKNVLKAKDTRALGMRLLINQSSVSWHWLKDMRAWYISVQNNGDSAHAHVMCCFRKYSFASHGRHLKLNPSTPLRKIHFSVILLFKKFVFWNPPPPWNFR